MATTILGWSEDVFWSSTPRKLYAVLFCSLSLKFMQSPQTSPPLSGKDAIRELAGLAQVLK